MEKLLAGLLVAAAAFFMVRAGRAGRTLWGPVLCTTLAVLAKSPRLFLQPATVSVLFLAVTLWVLVRPVRPADAPGAAVSPTAYWPLWPLFALWANVDEWFVLGPAAVAVYALGRWLEPPAAAWSHKCK